MILCQLYIYMCYLQCFSSGAEIGQHKNNHAYQFMVCFIYEINFILAIYFLLKY